MFEFTLSVVLLGALQAADAQYFWVVTDLHYDPTYHTSQKSCNFPIPPEDMGRYGHFKCDAPWELVKDAVKAMKLSYGTPDFVIWMGDTAPHYLNASIYEDFIIEMVQNVIDRLKHYFEQITVYPIIGNHDYYPVNQLPPSSSNMYTALGDMWQGWIGQEAADTFRTAGYYSANVTAIQGRQTVRLLVVNSNLYFERNHVTEDDEDPADQFAWMEQELSAARENREKVNVVAHMPPGVLEMPGTPSWFRENCNARYNSILQDFADIIIAVQSGHQHFDSFRIICDDSGAPAVPLFLSPSVTPWRARIPGGLYGTSHNPGIRLYKYNQQSVLVDYEQWYLDLPKANQQLETPWQRLYSFGAVYGVTNLTSSSLHWIQEDFKTNMSEKFHIYNALNSVNASDDSHLPCDCDCKFRHICAIENTELDDFEMCISDIACSARSINVSFLNILLAITAVCLLQLL